jgi:hypothetical protein
MIGTTRKGTVVRVPTPRWKGYVEVKDDEGHVHLLQNGLQTPHDIEEGESVEVSYQRYGGGALWFARRKEA